MFNPIIRGWIQYYGRFYKSHLYRVLRYLNRTLVHWVRRKYKKDWPIIAGERTTGWDVLHAVEPELFAHWQMGILPSAG